MGRPLDPPLIPSKIAPDERLAAGVTPEGLVVVVPTTGEVRTTRGSFHGPITWSADSQTVYVVVNDGSVLSVNPYIGHRVHYDVHLLHAFSPLLIAFVSNS